MDDFSPFVSLFTVIENSGLTIDLATVMRVGLIFFHLLAFAAAITIVLAEDIRLLVRTKVDMPALERAHRQLLWALGALAISGIIVIGIDTGFELTAILGSEKLLAKLSVVAALLVNGLVLSMVAFRILRDGAKRSRLAASGLSCLGAISTSSWLYAGFLGIAQPLTSTLGYSGFIILYVIILVVALTLAQVVARPRLLRLLVDRSEPGAAMDDSIASVVGSVRSGV